MSVNFSWGSNKDRIGKVIDANSTEVWLPLSATDADIALIAQLCKQLQKLGPGTSITDAGLRHLSALQQLQTLDLSGCRQVTDAGLRQLATLHQLQKLNLIGCQQITDAGLQHVGKLQQLQTLNLGGLPPDHRCRPT